MVKSLVGKELSQSVGVPLFFTWLQKAGLKTIPQECLGIGSRQGFVTVAFNDMARVRLFFCRKQVAAVSNRYPCSALFENPGILQRDFQKRLSVDERITPASFRCE